MKKSQQQQSLNVMQSLELNRIVLYIHEVTTPIAIGNRFSFGKIKLNNKL